MEPAWLVWARELQAIAQTGLTFTTGTYDRERYTAIRSLAARMMVTHSDANFVRVEGLFAEQAGYATPKVDVRGAVSEVAFFGENEIPEDLSVARVLPHQIARMFEHARCRDLPTEFD